MSRVASRAFTRAYATDHWLPTRARAWLERVESAAFTRALVDAMKTVPSLAGREDITASRIASRAEELYAEESSSRRELGDVESTHVKTAARALATYETLRPFLGNDEATLEFVRARAGSEKTATTMNGGLVRGALMLSGNRARALVGMVANVTNDLAPGAWTRTDDDDGGGGASFETTTCAYHAFFEKRDVAFPDDDDVLFAGRGGVVRKCERADGARRARGIESERRREVSRSRANVQRVNARANALRVTTRKNSVVRTTRALERERACVARHRRSPRRPRLARKKNRSTSESSRARPRRVVMSSDRAPARERTKDASASSAFDDARVAAVLARVASVKARSDALDEKKTSARDVLDADALDVDALVDGLDALRVTSAPTTRHPIARVQTPPPLARRRHRRTVSTSAAVSATRERERRDASGRRSRDRAR